MKYLGSSHSVYLTSQINNPHTYFKTLVNKRIILDLAIFSGGFANYMIPIYFVLISIQTICEVSY